MPERDKNHVKWNTPDVPPPRDRAFLITTAGPEVDIAFWDKDTHTFRDYFFRQKINMIYPYVFAWAEVPEPAEYGDTLEAHKIANDVANSGILGLAMQRKLASKCAELIQAGRTMPMAVTEMNEREYALFEIITQMSGFISFLSTFLDPEQRAMQARTGLDKT